MKLKTVAAEGWLNRQDSLVVREGVFFPLSKICTEKINWYANGGVREILEADGDRLKKDLGLRVSPITVKRAKGELVVRISNVTGSLFLLSRSIEIVPKFISASNEKYWSDILLEILARSRHKRYRYIETNGLLDRGLNFIDHVALAYVTLLERAIDQDKIRTYRSAEEELPVVRGSFLFQKTIINSLSRPHRYICNVDYLDENNQYNQLLGWALLQFQSSVFDPTIKQRLNLLEDSFVEPHTEYEIPNRLPLTAPSQYRHYEEPLEIASNLALGNNHSINGGKSSSYGYVINTEVIYEKFIEESLKIAVHILARNYNISVSAQDSMLYAEAITTKDRSYYTRPDNVIYQDDTPLILIDAKYKNFTDSETGSSKRPQNNDVYQLVASLVSYDCNIGVLLYPGMGGSESNGKNAFHIWKIGGGSDIRVVIGVSLNFSYMQDKKNLFKIDENLSNLVEVLMNYSLNLDSLNVLQCKMEEVWK